MSRAASGSAPARRYAHPIPVSCPPPACLIPAESLRWIYATLYAQSIALEEIKALLPSPWLALYPDIGNLSAWEENDVLHELRLGIDDTVAVHLKETRRPGQGPACFRGVPFGSGCVDFPAAFAHMEALGYTGPYTLEMWHREGNAQAEIRKAAAFVSQCFQTETSEIKARK